MPLALGEPTGDYPWRWSVVPWLPGRPPTSYDVANAAWADDLAHFVRALQSAPVADGPAAEDGARGAALHHWDDAVRKAIAACGDRIDRAAVTTAWDDAVSAPVYDGPPRWLHGDLLAGNLLVQDGALSAVIDFGALAVGDPAPDLQPAWCVLPASSRAAFRDALDVDDETWRRGRGWALGPALTGIPYYWESVPAFAERGLRTIAAVLDDLS